MRTELEHETKTFPVRVVCSNCLNEFDMRFEIGTRFDDHRCGSERRLVKFDQNGAAKDVPCLKCGIPRLHRKLTVDSPEVHIAKRRTS